MALITVPPIYRLLVVALIYRAAGIPASGTQRVKYSIAIKTCVQFKIQAWSKPVSGCNIYRHTQPSVTNLLYYKFDPTHAQCWDIMICYVYSYLAQRSYYHCIELIPHINVVWIPMQWMSDCQYYETECLNANTVNVWIPIHWMSEYQYSDCLNTNRVNLRIPIQWYTINNLATNRSTTG